MEEANNHGTNQEGDEDHIMVQHGEGIQDEEGEHDFLQDGHLSSNEEMVSVRTSTQSTEEWPSQGWDTSDHNSLVSETGSPIDVAGLFDNSGYNSANDNEVAIERESSGQHDSVQRNQKEDIAGVYQQEAAPWEVLASSVIGNYQVNQSTVSDSGLLNAKEGNNDLWRRINKMPRFKRKGIKRRRSMKKGNLGVTIGAETESGLKVTRKRKASSDPGFNYEAISEGDSAHSSSARSISTVHKRFCDEGRKWLLSLGSGEGTSKQMGRTYGKGKVHFMVEYEDENQMGVESMIDSASDSVHENIIKSNEDNDNDKSNEDNDNRDENGFAGVDQKQPSQSP